MKLKTINVQIIKPTLIVLAVFNHCNCDVANEMGQNREHMVRFPLLWNSNFYNGYCNCMFCSCFVLVLFLQRENTLKSIYYALLAVIFSLGLFEILWYYTAAAFRGGNLEIFQFAALFG